MRPRFRPVRLARVPRAWLGALALIATACDDPAAPGAPDTGAPSVRIVAPTVAGQEAVLGSATVELSGEVSDSVAVVRAAVRVNDGAEVPVPVEEGRTVSVRAPVSLRSGANVVRLLAYDKAGNAGVDSVSVVLDGSGPSITYHHPASDEVSAGDHRLFVMISDQSAVVAVSVQVNGAAPVAMVPGCMGTGLYPCGRRGELAGWEFTLRSHAAGPNRIVVRARDAHGNEAASERTIRVVPRVTVLSPTHGATLNADTARVSARAEYVAGITRVGYRVNGGPETTVDASIGTSGTFTLDVPLVDATNVIEVSAYDAAGNRGRAIVQLVRPVRGIATGPFVSISAGSGHACGLTADGAAYCWGSNSDGQLGTGGTRVSVDVPQRVAGNLAFAMVDAGSGYTCGVTRDGAAYCWGTDAPNGPATSGRLGDGRGTNALTPTRVAGSVEYAAVQTSYSTTCGLAKNGSVWCWGRGDVLGAQAPLCTSADFTSPCSPTPVQVQSGSAYQSLTTMGMHACGLLAGGAAECWGNGSGGAFGNGDKVVSRTTVAVRGGPFTSITAGRIQTCGVAAADGRGYCWGANVYGEVGDGTQFSERLTPVPIALPSRLSEISAGGNFTCALTEAGQPFCWGEDGARQLGRGVAEYGATATPGPVAGGLTLSTISAGDAMACGLTSRGAAYCWGKGVIGPMLVPNP